MHGPPVSVRCPNVVEAMFACILGPHRGQDSTLEAISSTPISSPQDMTGASSSAYVAPTELFTRSLIICEGTLVSLAFPPLRLLLRTIRKTRTAILHS